MLQKYSRRFWLALLLVLPANILAQASTSNFGLGAVPTPESLGFRHLTIMYQGDSVHILITNKVGDEQKPKPLFLFCQGSLPQPLIRYSDKGPYGVFPFRAEALRERYHVAIIGKPGIPLAADVKDLDPQLAWCDRAGGPPKQYTDNNHLEYYEARNKAVIDHLLSLPFISDQSLIVAGHSEGATIAVKMASSDPRITHLIYLSGNPLGRIMSIIQQQRVRETDTLSLVKQDLENWREIVANRTSKDTRFGDPPITTYGFSVPTLPDLLKLSIPVFVSYGTKDHSAPFNDYLQVECIRQGKSNFTFRPFTGAEHNFFPVRKDGSTNFEVFNWDLLIDECANWIAAHPTEK